ncbi:hypothetical protein SCBWM1_gp20 [Synechococcus phage S-CBWM1]|uniref:Uncharacterized protein n=1 Tax=Synechococcus phage S-CBWM1 TaxID=2053653 RepID=A0A3G1L3D2_9CAUD|nr:hypothetical protein HOU61_gp177 [Synechococcus phage S-CBWM1]ATW62704.1 hypothetical protein SCBWM1_gp20 [Synechococcus phage S-CBWM1]
MNETRQYVVVRKEGLSPEQQGVQAMHAAVVAEYEGGSVIFPNPYRRTFIVLEVRNKFRLLLVKLWLWVHQIPTYDFHEPDYNLGLTATSFFLRPGEFQLLGGLNLWKANSTSENK